MQLTPSENCCRSEEMYLFSKKIKCKKCQGNFRGITERGKRKYLCSTYHNYRTCIRYKVDESDIIYYAHKHMEIQSIKNGFGIGGSRGRGRPKKDETEKEKIDLDKIKEYVTKIVVDPDRETLEISYKDGTTTFLSPNRSIF